MSEEVSFDCPAALCSYVKRTCLQERQTSIIPFMLYRIKLVSIVSEAKGKGENQKKEEKLWKKSSELLWNSEIIRI